MQENGSNQIIRLAHKIVHNIFTKVNKNISDKLLLQNKMELKEKDIDYKHLVILSHDGLVMLMITYPQILMGPLFVGDHMKHAKRRKICW